MKKLLILLVLVFSSLFGIYAQELQCNVTVNAEQIKGTNKQVFTSLQKALTDFINNRKWTDLQYAQSEKIECSFVVVVSAQTENKFTATLQILARRPIYNANYYSPLFNFKDENFNFEYIETTPLEFTESSFGTNLTAVIAYYCYTIIGYDCDSYTPMGGTPYFNKAEAIVNMAQSQSEKGWKAFEDSRNRYALINNLLDDNLKSFRQFYYEYHRLGLDEMANGVEKGSSKIASSIQVLRDVNRLRPSCVAITSFLETKNDELVNIFSKAPSTEKTDVYNLLMDINSSESAKYEPILKN